MNLKRVTFVIGFDNQGKPMSLAFSANEFREIYFSEDDKYIVMSNTKPDSTEPPIQVVYPVDKYYAIEFQEEDKKPWTKTLDLKADKGLDVA